MFAARGAVDRETRWGSEVSRDLQTIATGIYNADDVIQRASTTAADETYVRMYCNHSVLPPVLLPVDDALTAH
jgi:hypothetical protein